MKILFVCLGNICRSPTAHGVMETKLKERKLAWIVDSAGTAGYHIGKAPDPRSQSVAKEQGYELSHLRARQATQQDFYDFDYIFAMDKQNYQDLNNLKPDDARAQLKLALEYSALGISDVPDPYYGGDDEFRNVLMICETACDDILSSIAANSDD